MEDNNQLVDAAADGNVALVEQALQNGAHVEVTDVCGQTALRWACWKGHLDVVQYLLTSHAANLEATDNNGWSPLHCACNRGQLDVVQELVARGADLFVTDDVGKTPLHYACLWGHLAVVQVLVARGADLFVTAGNGDTAFDIAHDHRQSNAVDYLLHAYVEKVTASEGSQAIHSILQSATFSYVTAHPPLKLQVQLPLGKLTLNHFQTLLQLFPVNSFCSQDNDGDSPLHVAGRAGAPVEIIHPIVQAYTAALQTRNHNGNLPLHAACQADAPSLESIRFVVEQDPNAVQAANNDGALPLHLLCGSRPSVQAVQYLLGLFEGALAMRTHQGDMPFMVACKASSSESVLQILLTVYPEALIYMQKFYHRRVPRDP